MMVGKSVRTMEEIDMIDAGRVVRADDWHTIPDIVEDGLCKFVQIEHI